MQTMRSKGAAGLPGMMATVLLAAGCAGTPALPELESAATESAPATSNLRGPIAQLALSMVGVRYRYGGADPTSGFDCSGLVYYTYTSNGHAVPRTSREQFSAARGIPLAQAVEGDLVFFNTNGRGVSHVGVYLGNNKFIHASVSRGVMVSGLFEPYYIKRYIGAGRIEEKQMLAAE